MADPSSAVAGYREALQSVEREMTIALELDASYGAETLCLGNSLQVWRDRLRAALADPAPSPTCEARFKSYRCRKPRGHQGPHDDDIVEWTSGVAVKSNDENELSSDPRPRPAPSGSWECAAADCHTINPASNWFCARCGTRRGDGAAPSGGTGESPVLAFHAWLERLIAGGHRRLTQDEYFIAQAAFFAAHPGEGPTSQFMAAPSPSEETPE